MEFFSLQQDVHNIPGMMGSLNITKVHWKDHPTAEKDHFKVRRSLQITVWMQLLTITYGSDMLLLDLACCFWVSGDLECHQHMGTLPIIQANVQW